VKVFFYVIIGLVAILSLTLGYGVYRTWKTGRMAEYAEFKHGVMPVSMPDGAWNGSAPELGEISWKGKQFIGGVKGINVFQKNGVTSQAFPFKYFQSKGYDSPSVIRLDYAQPGNPVWLQFIVDEMVSVGDNKFLGLVYIKLIPGFPLRMGYFRLQK
jgi:hypothetical protein